jgi:Global regulator protein family
MGLSITKRRGEKFWIGSEIQITVRSVEFDRATLIVDADKDAYPIRHHEQPEAAFKTLSWFCTKCKQSGQVHVEKVHDDVAQATMLILTDHAGSDCDGGGLQVT